MTELDIRYDLDGWALFSTLLVRAAADGSALARLLDDVAAAARERLDHAALADHPTVAAMRRLFRQAGCDPTRYRPSSEALVRRLLKGEPIPRVDPLVDLNNALSATLLVPCCVMADGTFGTALELRRGRENEAYASLRGPFRLADRPLLADAEGPVDAPITGSERVKVRPETERAWLVAYLPAATLTPERASAALDDLLARAPVARRVA